MKQFEYYSIYSNDDCGMLSREDAQQIADKIGESIEKSIYNHLNKER